MIQLNEAVWTRKADEPLEPRGPILISPLYIQAVGPHACGGCWIQLTGKDEGGEIRTVLVTDSFATVKAAIKIATNG